MKVTVIGLGYVGLTQALFLAKHHQVLAHDIDYEKLQSLTEGKVYLREPGLTTLLKKHKENLTFSDQLEFMIAESDVAMIAVPTPESDLGKPDLSAIESVMQQVIAFSKPNQIIIIRSTVPPGTHQQLLTYMQQAHRTDLHLVSMPEFLALGSALKDVSQPHRVVLGLDDMTLVSQIKALYRYRNTIPWVVTTPQTAELIKYGSNTYLANRISFINDLSQIAEMTNADIEQVVMGMSLDKRIGKAFIKPGIGFGGSCFPKDLKALYQLAQQGGLNARMIEATIKTNQEQIERFVNRVLQRFSHNLVGKKIAILGLAYKGNTNDVRNSPAFKVIDMLTEHQAMITGYDKWATMNFFLTRGEKPCVGYSTQIMDALQDADCAIILNNAKEIEKLKPKDFIQVMKTPIVFDGRNLFNPDNMKGVEYHSIGRKSQTN
jgi:UDPglucose 6-dehydrogenase